MSEFETLAIDVHDGWAEITLNRPDVLNALNRQMVDDLHAALEQLATNEDVRGLIFLGAGDRAFVAGADISELVDRSRADALLGINAAVFQKIEDFPWPTIAVIRGFALGGGCEMALSCDIRLGGESAQMGQPEVKLGIIPGAGAPHRLTRTVGSGRARELIFVGGIIEADEALRIGLLNHVYPDGEVLTHARKMMERMLRNSPMAMRVAKVALNAASNTVDRRSSMVECLGQGLLFDSDDQRKRMTDFLEKRSHKN